MAFRIDKSIVKGWIDNTTPGMTRGGLEIMGIERPVKLVLRGDCWRDLAGTRITFTNPHPEYDEDVALGLQTLQRGVVSDMTASKRVKAPLLSEQQMQDMGIKPSEVPYGLKNALYLEWFSLVNGRVIIDTTDFEVRISPHQWELDEAGEKKQKAENKAAMEHFMEIMLIATEAQAEVLDVEGEVDEFEWEKRLRVRDTLEEAQWFLNEGAPSDQIQQFELEEVTLDGRVPLIQHAILVQNIALDLIGNETITNGVRTDLVLAVSYIYDALDEVWPTRPINVEIGYKLAMLKRVLEACNCAISDCNELIAYEPKFEALRAHIFHLRDLLVDKLQKLRGTDAA